MNNHPSFRRSLSWADAIAEADDSTAVDSVTGSGPVTVKWCDGNKEEISDPQQLANSVRAMEGN